jgi:hypothetical protein
LGSSHVRFSLNKPKKKKQKNARSCWKAHEQERKINTTGLLYVYKTGKEKKRSRERKKKQDQEWMQRNTTAEKEKNKTMNECRERKKTRPGMNVEKHNCRKRKKQDQEWMQRKKKTRPGMNAEKHNCRKKKCLKKIELAWTGAATHVAAHVSHTDHHRKLGLGSKRRERTGSKSQTSKTALCIKVYKRNERKTEVLKEEKKLELELPSSYDLIFFF